MEIKKGSVVRSKAGRDKGYIFLVLDIEADSAYIADGKKRRIENPKKKKLKHLQGFCDIIPLGGELSNAWVRKALAVYG